MHTTYENFLESFKFVRRLTGFVGCEREFFLTDLQGNIQPFAEAALSALSSNCYKYELSACQAEMNIGPVAVDDFAHEAELVTSHLKCLRTIGIGHTFMTVAPENMPLNVYPDPSGRYQRIVANIPRESLLAACRVAGTHVHVGMPDMDTAIRVHARIVEKYYEELCDLGNMSGGERLGIYRKMAPKCDPIPFANSREMHAYYVENGFDEDPRRCWHLIRISVHGTIEFRPFDNTANLGRVETWVRKCHGICMSAM